VVSNREWVEARKAFLAKEKEFTRLRDQLSQQRQDLPWERVEKNYVFDGPNGKGPDSYTFQSETLTRAQTPSRYERSRRSHPCRTRSRPAPPHSGRMFRSSCIPSSLAPPVVSLADLFGSKSQLIVYHFMMGPGWPEGCPSCSLVAENIDGSLVHLADRDVTLLAVSRATLPEIEAFKRRMGWRFKWVSSNGNDFNWDYRVSFTKEPCSEGTRRGWVCVYDGVGSSP
jgi:predicted dithiol-disulfide oxidoreductase (DUF899 family)